MCSANDLYFSVASGGVAASVSCLVNCSLVAVFGSMLKKVYERQGNL